MGPVRLVRSICAILTNLKIMQAFLSIQQALLPGLMIFWYFTGFPDPGRSQPKIKYGQVKLKLELKQLFKTTHYPSTKTDL